MTIFWTTLGFFIGIIIGIITGIVYVLLDIRNNKEEEQYEKM